MSDDDPLRAVEKTVARMEGMLTQALLGQDFRFSTNESSINAVTAAHTETAAKVTQHQEKISGLTNQITEIKNNQKTSFSKFIGTASVVIAAAGFLFIMLKDLYTT